MDEFKQTYLNGEEINSVVYGFARRANKVGLVKACLYASNANQIAVRFNEMVTSFRDETARELQRVAARSLFENEAASFTISSKSRRFRYTLTSPYPDRDQQTRLVPFDEGRLQACLDGLSF